VVSGVAAEGYRNKRAVRSAVERKFIIIGEVLGRVVSLDERLYASTSNFRAIADFRAMLARDYVAVDDDAIFGIVYSGLIVSARFPVKKSKSVAGDTGFV